MLYYFKVNSKMTQPYTHTHTHTNPPPHLSILFEILSHDRLLPDTEYRFLCNTVGPCCLFYIQ